MYGPVRTVVWQGSAGDCRPYADRHIRNQIDNLSGEAFLKLMNLKCLVNIRPIVASANQIIREAYARFKTCFTVPL